MSVQSIRLNRVCDVLLSANHQLEQIYYQQHDPCLALHISRNYSLLHKQQDRNDYQQQQWRDKAKIWWQLYWMERAGKGLGLFYDENGLFYDNI